MELNERDGESNAFPQARGTPGAEKPYCWQCKYALRAIREAYGDAPGTLPYMISTYVSCTEIASDLARPVFTKSVAEIAAHSGGSSKQIGKMLTALERLGLLQIQKNFIHHGDKIEKAKSTYTLVSLRNGIPNPLGKLEGRSVPIEEKKSYEKKEKNISDWRSHYSTEELKVIDLYHAECCSRGWWAVNADSAQLHEVIQIFGREEDEWFATTFRDAANERDAGDQAYNTPRGNTLINLLYRNR